nr:hypothetical protein CFP56_78735 [Quercus suber]
MHPSGGGQRPVIHRPRRRPLREQRGFWEPGALRLQGSRATVVGHLRSGEARNQHLRPTTSDYAHKGIRAAVWSRSGEARNLSHTGDHDFVLQPGGRAPQTVHDLDQSPQ